MSEIKDLQEQYLNLYRRRIALGQPSSENANEWAKILVQEKPIAYELAVSLFVQLGNIVADPYCCVDSDVEHQILSRLDETGRLYLIDNDPKVISTFRDIYSQPNVEIVEATIPLTDGKVPRNLDVVVMKKELNEAIVDQIFPFLDAHLKKGGYFVDLVWHPDCKPHVTDAYPLITHLFNQESSMVHVYQKK